MDKASTLEARLIEEMSSTISDIDTRIGENTDVVGTTTLFARLRQIVDTYLADGTVGLTALKALIDANQVDLDAIIVDTTSIETKVDAIQTDLDNATDGLGALKALIDINQVDLDAIIVDTTSIETKVDAVQADLDNATDGLGALKALIDANQVDLNSVLAKTDLINSASGLGTLNDANTSDTIIPTKLPTDMHLIFSIRNIIVAADDFDIEVKVGPTASEDVVAYYNITSDGVDTTIDKGSGAGSIVKERKIDISSILVNTGEQVIVQYTKNGAISRDVLYKYLCGV